MSKKESLIVPIKRLKRRLCNHSGYGVHSPFAFHSIYHLLEYHEGRYTAEEEFLSRMARDLRLLSASDRRMILLAIRLRCTFPTFSVHYQLQNSEIKRAVSAILPETFFPQLSPHPPIDLPDRSHYALILTDRTDWLSDYIKNDLPREDIAQWVVCMAPISRKLSSSWLQALPYGHLYDVAEGAALCLHPKLLPLRCKTFVNI